MENGSSKTTDTTMNFLSEISLCQHAQKCTIGARRRTSILQLVLRCVFITHPDTNKWIYSIHNLLRGLIVCKIIHNNIVYLSYIILIGIFPAVDIIKIFL